MGGGRGGHAVGVGGAAGLVVRQVHGLGTVQLLHPSQVAHWLLHQRRLGVGMILLVFLVLVLQTTKNKNVSR